MEKLSKAQIDRLGNRLRRDPILSEDIILLDSYRRSYGYVYGIVVGTIRDQLSVEVSGRPAKSTNSIIEKLKRETIRLTQIQDIAGCRLVVADSLEQERILGEILKLFRGNATVIDRRKIPTYGYRAVHVVISCEGKLVELQIRTRFQHLWAEISEKFADLYGIEIKYGGGNPQILALLKTISGVIASHEELEIRMAGLAENKAKALIRSDLGRLRGELSKELANLIDKLSPKQGGSVIK